MKLQGYALIKQDAKCNFAMQEPDHWQGKICRVMEFNDQSKSALVINSRSSAMAMFDYDDIELKFECHEVDEVIIPKTDNHQEAFSEVYKRISRKGGYNKTVRSMVIITSLQKGEFDDRFLFVNQ